MAIEKYTREQLAIFAGVYAICRLKNYALGTYCVWDKTTNEHQEITFVDAEKILLQMAEGEEDKDD